MQIQLISIRLERPFTDAEVERLLRLVPPERRQRLAHLKDPVVGLSRSAPTRRFGSGLTLFTAGVSCRR